MKKVLALILAVLMFATMMVGCTKAPADKDDTESKKEMTDMEYVKDKGELVIGITDYAPMNYQEGGKWVGFDTEYAELVCAALGVKAKFIEIDWDNKISELDSKAIDCVWNGMTLTDEVVKAMSTSDAYINNEQVVVMKKDKIDAYKDAASMKDLQFSVEGGSAGEDAAEDAGFKFTAVLTQADALMEVNSGAADACIIDITMAKAMTGEGTSYADMAFGLSLVKEEYGIGFRKGSDLTAEVNKITQQLIKDGKLQDLGKKYDLTDSLVCNQK